MGRRASIRLCTGWQVVKGIGWKTSTLVMSEKRKWEYVGANCGILANGDAGDIVFRFRFLKKEKNAQVYVFVEISPGDGGSGHTFIMPMTSASVLLLPSPFSLPVFTPARILHALRELPDHLTL